MSYGVDNSDYLGGLLGNEYYYYGMGKLEKVGALGSGFESVAENPSIC